LPPQSPNRVPDHGADAPVTAMSLRSASDNAATAATVSVDAAAGTPDLTNILFTAVAGAPSVNVPDTVLLLLNIRVVSRVPVVLVMLRLLNVLAPDMVFVLAPTVVNDTL